MIRMIRTVRISVAVLAALLMASGHVCLAEKSPAPMENPTAAQQGTATQQDSAATPRKSVSAGRPDTVSWNFEDVALGALPAGWRSDATRGRGILPTWQVIADSTAPSGSRALAMIRPNHTSGGTFNLCWTDSISFLDGQIDVRFRALTGKEDRGGGVMWRVQDHDNYYVARFNPLEDNFRIYYVRDGVRRMLASARIALSAGQWHELRIVQSGNRFSGHLDGKKLLEGTNDVFPRAGGVGLWTKADAVSSFDDFSVKARTE